jgi:arylsulfatase A-like enzyme/Flp pilus assembly protein TadD
VAKPRSSRGNRSARKPAASPHRTWPRIILIALAVIVALAFALSRIPGLRRSWRSAAVPARPSLSLLLITLDTTRADHLGIYGYQRARTRHLDQLAREGVRFEWAFSPAPITLPAHASILTGLYPFAHGVRNNGNFYLSDKLETLTTILQKRGYRTAAFVSSFILDRRYGLARGFEAYDDRMEGESAQILALEAERRGDRTALALDAWLTRYAANPSAPFFAWLHLYDPHEPYHAPPPFGPAFADSPYDGEIAFDDAIVASVMDKLDQLGLKDRTLVAIIGDHGESLGDHGEETHSMFVYDAAIRVPFILWRPGLLQPGTVVRQPVRATDLAPTVLELLGAPPLRTDHGRSLVGLIRGARDERTSPVYAETLLPQLYNNWAPLRAIRDERWKLIEAPRPELYDVGTDPGEVRNLYADRAQTARGLQQELGRLTGGVSGEMSVGKMDRETLEKLASLGYIGAGAEPAPGSEPSRLPDPKDMIGVFNRLRAANSAVRDRRYGEALPILREILAKDPRNAFAQLVLGSAHMGMGDYRAAIAQYRKYLDLVPTSSYAHQWMAICYLRLGDRQNAVREADAALAIDPRFSDARILKGGVLAARGDYPGALAELRAAVEADPAKPSLRLDLAKVLAEAGQTGEAQKQYEAALEIQSDYAPALSGLGALYARQGKFNEAVAILQRALATEPRREDARFNLAKAYEGMGRASEARTEYERLVRAPATSPAVRDAARERLSALGPPGRH